MNDEMMKATEILWEQIGQDRPMALATATGNRAAVRMVNVYIHEGNIYFITSSETNKYAQMQEKPGVSLCVDAIQISGMATLLGHPKEGGNKQFIDSIETLLPEQFTKYSSASDTRLIMIKPEHGSFLLMENGEGYVMNFVEGTAFPIKHEM